MDLGNIETGNAYAIRATFIAMETAPTAESTDVEFTIIDPAGASVTVGAPDATITGPTNTVLADGRHQSVWVYTHAAPTLPGRYTVRSRSTAGIVGSRTDHFDVPAYVPLASA